MRCSKLARAGNGCDVKVALPRQHKHSQAYQSGDSQCYYQRRRSLTDKRMTCYPGTQVVEGKNVALAKLLKDDAVPLRDCVAQVGHTQ